MKKIFFLLLISINSFVFSQSEPEISEIKSKVEFINGQYKNYKIIDLKNDAEQKEIFIDESKNIKLIRETYSNETGKTIIWDYIENNHAYFILKEYFIYKISSLKNNFSTTDFNKTEEGYYFKNDRIIRWVKDKKVVKKYPKNAAAIENNIIEHIADLIDKYTKQTTK